jgi:hypothetical protein
MSPQLTPRHDDELDWKLEELELSWRVQEERWT